ncbi:MAG TPA: hypothetical protein VEW93_13965 [Acidimicrobiales bacterium]|nr:hypothetical protein [Acidimicrobiales bacterium]
MGLLSGAAKAGLARKVWNEVRKPANQQKAKDMLGRLRDSRSGPAGRRERPPR